MAIILVLMQRYLVGSILGLALCATGLAQDIRLSKVYSKSVRPDCTRFVYVFSAKNNTRHRLNLVGSAILLDAQMNPLDQRYVSFETPAGQTSDCSIESDEAPVYCDEVPGKACFFKLKLEDNALRRPLEYQGAIKGPITHKAAY
jgi:hypothetical protein